VRAVCTPGQSALRRIGQNDQVPFRAGHAPHRFEQPPPLALGQFIMPEHDARSAWQPRNDRHGVAKPRIGHQPDFGKRLAAAHGRSYSARMQQTMENAESRLANVRTAIAKAAKIAGRAADATTLIAVSKTKTVAEIAPLIAAGQRHFGENRVQEAQEKWPAPKAAHPDICLHLVGQLQSNKAEDAVALFDTIHSLDRPSLVAALGTAQDKIGRRPACFIQVNIGGEEQKGGCAVAGLPALLKTAREAGLDVAGLMAVPPATHEPAPYFALLAKLARDHGLSALSMGMSGDFETAVKLGATHVRVGTALFGTRT
jgi:PLP dependent protein